MEYFYFDIIFTNVGFIRASLYKYWLVPTSTLKNFAPKLCNVARGPKAEGNIAQLRAKFFSVDRG